MQGICKFPMLITYIITHTGYPPASAHFADSFFFHVGARYTSFEILDSMAISKIPSRVTSFTPTHIGCKPKQRRIVVKTQIRESSKSIHFFNF